MNSNTHPISVTIYEDSFVLDGLRSKSTTNVYGIISIHATNLCLRPPPTWVRIQLVGKEQVGASTKIIMNNSYQLSSCPGDWCFSIDNPDEYTFPFSLSVPSNIPVSFQVRDSNFSSNTYDSKDASNCLVLGGIYYTLEVSAASIGDKVIQPIQFHRSCNNIKLDQALISNGFASQHDHNNVPKRVFWGTAKQSKLKWQYELEFQNSFELSISKTGFISIRLKSTHSSHYNIATVDQVGGKSYGCCLIGCQIIQSVHIEGYHRQYKILATATQVLNSPHKTWLQPCQIEFELDDEEALPTVENERIGVEHIIRITAVFSDECDTSIDLDFPVTFTGYNKLPLTCTADSKSSLLRSNSVSSSSSIEESITSSAEDNLCSIAPLKMVDCGYFVSFSNEL